MANENKYLDYAGVSALWGKIKDKISADIGTLDVTAITGNQGKTITSISETDGKITATYSDIAIAQSAVDGLTGKLADLEKASTNHTHGNITSAGAITTTATIENGDALVITDTNNSNKLVKTSITFDGSSTGSYLTKKGTFESLPTATSAAKGIMQVGAGLSVTNGTVSINSTSASKWDSAATVAKAAADAISAMDYTATGLGAGKTITGFTQTDGKIALTASDISITKSQISDFPSSMTPTSHTHGNITNDGKIGSTANLPLITTTNGTVTTGSFGTAANTFCQGNDSRLSNARTPTAHATSATTYGVGTTANYGHVKLASGELSGVNTLANGVAAASYHTHGQYVTQAEFDNKLKVADAMRFKGVVDSTHSLPTTHNVGDTYKVAAAGTYAGQECELGDMIICQTSGTAAKNDDWTVLQTNIDGAVTGPASSTDDHIVTFDKGTGKAIKDSGKTVTTTVGTDDTTLPTSLAVKTFVEGKGYKTTDEHVTTVGNHYTPTATTSINAANGTATQLPTSNSNPINVVVGLSADAAGHITAVTSKALWSPNNDTKNTAGTTNKSAAKMYLVGATAQSANPQTFSNSAVYIDTDNCLYSNGAKVLTTATDTKNTVGADQSTSKLFLVGTTAQTTNNGSARSYSNQNVYISGGYVYSNGQQIVALTPITPGEIDTICV